MIDSYRSDLKYNGVSIKLINTDEMILTVKSKSDQICVIQFMKSWGYPANLMVLTIITLHSDKIFHFYAHQSKQLTAADEKLGVPSHFDSVTLHSERILSLISTKTLKLTWTTFLNYS